MSNETELRDFIKQQAASMRRGGKVLLVVGIILVVVIVGYFSYILGWLKKNYQCSDVIDVAFAQVEALMADRMPQLEGWVMDQAPVIMDRAKEEIIENLPKLREQGEEYLSSVADSLTAKIQTEISDQVRELMEDPAHAASIRSALEAVSDIQKTDAADELEAVLREQFEEVAEKEIDPDKDEWLEALEDLHGQLTVLVETPPEQLDEVQQLERELIEIIYTLLSRTYGRIKG